MSSLKNLKGIYCRLDLSLSKLHLDLVNELCLKIDYWFGVFFSCRIPSFFDLTKEPPLGFSASWQQAKCCPLSCTCHAKNHQFIFLLFPEKSLSLPFVSGSGCKMPVSLVHSQTLPLSPSPPPSTRLTPASSLSLHIISCHLEEPSSISLPHQLSISFQFSSANISSFPCLHLLISFTFFSLLLAFISL